MAWLLAFGVASWMAGFDVIYACPDAAVDRGENLRSIPRALGVRNAFRVATLFHTTTVALLSAAAHTSPTLGAGWLVAMACGAVVLVVEHLLVRPGHYARMATAFFRLNALFGALALAGAAFDVF